MAELTIEEKEEFRALLENKEKLRAFLENEDGLSPDLADLPARWDLTPDAPDPERPNCSQRLMLIVIYSNWAITKTWAWEGLQRLLAELIERGEPVPLALRLAWSDPFAAGRRKPPSRRGRPDKTERDARITHFLRASEGPGFPQEDMMRTIADAMGLSYETVRSAVRKMRKTGILG